MCIQAPQDVLDSLDLETANNASSDSSLTQELIEDYNTKLYNMCDFLPTPIELIFYLIQKCGKVNSALDILLEIQDFNSRTSILYIIMEFKEREYFNLQGTTDSIMRQFITEKLTINNNLAYIHDEKCTLCGKCIDICPTTAIIEINN